MTLTINAEHGDAEDSSAGHGDPRASSAQHRLADELLDELASMQPRDRTRMFHAWHQGGLSIVQLSAANLLLAEGPQSMGRVADALGVSIASATGIVSRMEERGLVERRHDASDRRIVQVHPAPGAVELFRSLEQQRREHLSKLLDQLSEQELAGFLTGLRALRAARERATGGRP